MTEIKISKEFKDGIYFSCEKCGACCRGLNEGEVYLYKDDIKRLIKFLNKKGKKYSLRSFARKHLKIIDETFYWKEKDAKRGRSYRFKTLAFKFTDDDEHCEFLSEDNKCTVYEARTFQCRAYPIGWNLLINNMRNFRNYSKKCPALKKSLENKGHFYSREEILSWAKREYEIEKEFFLKMKKQKFDIFKVYKFLPKDMLIK